MFCKILYITRNGRIQVDRIRVIVRLRLYCLLQIRCCETYKWTNDER